ncbi:MAG: hypothetical protein AABX70_01505 [Nanoarchaeota archaeon]
MDKILKELIKDIWALANDCAQIEKSLELDPSDSEASRAAMDFLRGYLNEVLSYLNACVHLLKTQETIESSVREKLEQVKEFSYGTSQEIVKECFDQISACERKEDKEIKQTEFVNDFMKKVFERLKKFTELLHTYSHPSEWHKKVQISLETYNAIIDSVRKLSVRTNEIASKIQGLVKLHEATKKYVEESYETLQEYFNLLKEGYKDPDLFRTAQANIRKAASGKGPE